MQAFLLKNLLPLFLALAFVPASAHAGDTVNGHYYHFTHGYGWEEVASDQPGGKTLDVLPVGTKVSIFGPVYLYKTVADEENGALNYHDKEEENSIGYVPFEKEVAGVIVESAYDNEGRLIYKVKTEGRDVCVDGFYVGDP